MQLLGTVPQPTTPTYNPMNIYFISLSVLTKCKDMQGKLLPFRWKRSIVELH